MPFDGRVLFAAKYCNWAGYFKVFLIITLVFQISLSMGAYSPVFAQAKKSDFRLSKVVVPESYKIYIEPDIENKQFSGSVSIFAQVNKSIDKIVLNANQLEIAEPEISKVSPVHGEWLKPELKFDKKSQRVILQLKQKLKKGRHELRMKFAGKLNDKLVGFYYSSSKSKDGKPIHIASTQMEPTDARRVFPCFDEPDFKATFKISIGVDKGQVAISNAPVKFIKEDQRNNKVIYNFDETPKMSTYLVALVVGPFQSTEAVTVNGVKVKIWATPGQKDQCVFAESVVKKLLPYFEEYFGVKYPAKKLDLIAIPDFGPGAMENLGAITFRETRLLVDPKTASTQTKQSVASVVAHEMAHMWFGDLVTMKWWDDLWLNEAFATWMSVKAVDYFKPEWKPWDSFVSERAYSLGTDALKSTRSIYSPVNNPVEAEEMFDEITYEKGASVLRMLENYLGENTYKKGIQNYISEHQFSNAEGQDLWKALGKASGKPVLKIMRNWVSTPGYPVVSIKNSNGSNKFKIEQRRFLLSSGKKDNSKWQIPVTFKYLKDGTTKETLFSANSSSIKLDQDKGPILVNANASGYFRVKYESANLAAIAKLMDSKLDAKERYQLLSDAWAMVEAGNLPISKFLDLTGYYKNENDPTVVGLLIERLYHLERFIDDNKLRKKFSGFVRDRLVTLTKELGWSASSDESDLKQILRGRVLLAMGTIGQDQETIATARDKFSIYAEDNKALNANLYDAIVGIVAYNGDARDYETLLNLWRESSSQDSKIRNLMALGDFRNPSLQRRTLKLSLTNQVKTQDAPHLIKHILETTDGRQKGWKFVKKNWSEMEKKFPVHLFPRVIKGTKSFVTQDSARELDEFLANHPIKAGSRISAKVLETVKLNARVNDKSGKELTAYLEKF